MQLSKLRALESVIEKKIAKAKKKVSLLSNEEGGVWTAILSFLQEFIKHYIVDGKLKVKWFRFDKHVKIFQSSIKLLKALYKALV